MSSMLGRTSPHAEHCCTRHCGKYKMNAKRAKENKQWKKELNMEDTVKVAKPF